MASTEQPTVKTSTPQALSSRAHELAAEMSQMIDHINDRFKPIAENGLRTAYDKDMTMEFAETALNALLLERRTIEQELAKAMDNANESKNVVERTAQTIGPLVTKIRSSYAASQAKLQATASEEEKALLEQIQNPMVDQSISTAIAKDTVRRALTAIENADEIVSIMPLAEELPHDDQLTDDLFLHRAAMHNQALSTALLSKVDADPEALDTANEQINQALRNCFDKLYEQKKKQLESLQDLYLEYKTSHGDVQELSEIFDVQKNTAIFLKNTLTNLDEILDLIKQRFGDMLSYEL